MTTTHISRALAACVLLLLTSCVLIDLASGASNMRRFSSVVLAAPNTTTPDVATEDPYQSYTILGHQRSLRETPSAPRRLFLLSNFFSKLLDYAAEDSTSGSGTSNNNNNSSSSSEELKSTSTHAPVTTPALAPSPSSSSSPAPPPSLNPLGEIAW